MLKKDLSHLPTATDADEGLLPDDDPVYVRMLVDEIREAGTWPLTFTYEVDKPQVDNSTLTRHSSSGKCMKRVALIRDGAEQEPMDEPGLWVTFLGTMVHEAWQRAVSRTRAGAVECEVPSTIDDLTSGSCDLLHNKHGGTTLVELKTTGGFGYKMMVGERGPAKGPKTDALVQLAINVRGHDADEGVLVYLATEGISKGLAERKGIDETTRFGAQWTFTREQLDPLADEWIAQLEWIRDHPTSEVPRFVPHELPRGARLDPTTGSWTQADSEGNIVDTGEFWSKGVGCTKYCPVADACKDEFLSEGAA